MMQHSSFRVQRSSVGCLEECSQCRLEGCSVAQKGASKAHIWCNVDLSVQHSSGRVQRSWDGSVLACCKAGPGFKSRPGTPGRTLLTERQQWGCSRGSRRFFAGFSLYLIYFAGRISEAASWEGGARSGLFFLAKSLKNRFAQRWGEGARQKPTSKDILSSYHVFQ